MGDKKLELHLPVLTSRDNSICGTSSSSHAFMHHQQLTVVSASAVSEDILQDRFVAFANVFERVLVEC